MIRGPHSVLVIARKPKIKVIACVWMRLKIWIHHLISDTNADRLTDVSLYIREKLVHYLAVYNYWRLDYLKTLNCSLSTQPPPHHKLPPLHFLFLPNYLCTISYSSFCYQHLQRVVTTVTKSMGHIPLHRSSYLTHLDDLRRKTRQKAFIV